MRERAKGRGRPADAPGRSARSSGTRAARGAGDRLEARSSPGRPPRASRRSPFTPPAAPIPTAPASSPRAGEMPRSPGGRTRALRPLAGRGRAPVAAPPARVQPSGRNAAVASWTHRGIPPARRRRRPGRGSARPCPAERAKCRGCPAGAPGCFARSSGREPRALQVTAWRPGATPAGRPAPPGGRPPPRLPHGSGQLRASGRNAGVALRSRPGTSPARGWGVERGASEPPRGRTNGRKAGVPTGDTPAFRPFVEKWGIGKAPAAAAATPCRRR